jgi:AcrR family transcriptional regulator
MPPLRPQLRARYDRRRQAVVDACAHVFAERGFHATSVAALLRDTGLTAGGLYHYVASKEELLVLICEELMDPLLEQATQIASSQDAAHDQLRELVRAWLEHIERHLDHMRVFQQERHVIEHDPRWAQLREKRLAFERLLDGVLERAGRFPDRRLALLSLLGMVNYTPTWFRPGGRLSARQIADGYTDQLLAAYGGSDR